MMISGKARRYVSRNILSYIEQQSCTSKVLRNTSLNVMNIRRGAVKYTDASLCLRIG